MNRLIRGRVIPNISDSPSCGIFNSIRTLRGYFLPIAEGPEEEGRCAGDLMEQIRTVQSGYPDSVVLLQRISEDEKRYCDKIREMLMRSDAFAGSPKEGINPSVSTVKP